MPIIAAEARRRQLSPSGLMGQVIDQWARALKSGAWPRNSLAPCAFPGCPRPLYVRGLCRTHHAQRERGQELTPIRAQGPGEAFAAFGHLRLPAELSRRLRRTAASRGIPVAELVRQVLEAGLP